MRGANLLELITGWTAGHDGLPASADLAEATVGRRDGRAVAQALSRLERAGLVMQPFTGRTWRATPRGREVDEILRAVTHARGGTFKPLSQTGMNHDEIAAVQQLLVRE